METQKPTWPQDDLATEDNKQRWCCRVGPRQDGRWPGQQDLFLTATLQLSIKKNICKHSCIRNYSFCTSKKIHNYPNKGLIKDHFSFLLIHFMSLYPQYAVCEINKSKGKNNDLSEVHNQHSLVKTKFPNVFFLFLNLFTLKKWFNKSDFKQCWLW